jgi:positive regulator of sigma E activity
MSELLYINNIGKLYKDLVIIDNNKFLLKRIVSINVEEKAENKINLFFFIFFLFFFLIAQVVITNFLFFYLLLILCSILLLFSVIYNNKVYYLIFSMSAGDQSELRIKSKNEEEVKKFLNLILQAKEKSNLM